MLQDLKKVKLYHLGKSSTADQAELLITELEKDWGLLPGAWRHEPPQEGTMAIC
jgi:hypothetical protein